MGAEAQPQLAAALAEFGRQVNQFLHHGAQAPTLCAVANGYSGANRPLIPLQIVHRFRRKSSTDSAANRPPIPVDSDHPFRGNRPPIPD